MLLLITYSKFSIKVHYIEMKCSISLALSKRNRNATTLDLYHHLNRHQNATKLPLTAASHWFPLCKIIHLEIEKSLKVRQLKKLFFYFTDKKNPKDASRASQL